MKKIALSLFFTFASLNAAWVQASPVKCQSSIANHPINLKKHWKQVDLGSSLNTLNWQRIAVSGNGKYQTSVVKKVGNDGTGGNIFLSEDYGRSWKGSPYNFNLGWEGIALSKTGKYQTAVAEGDYIYISSNYGKKWEKVLGTQGNWVEVAISADGKYQTAVANDFYSDENTGKGIFTSSNYGKTWKPALFPNAWIGVSMSADGKFQTASSFLIYGTSDPENRQGYVYQSNDHGETWHVNESLPQGYYTMTAISGNGKIQVVGDSNCNYGPAIPGPLYISYNYGQTFKEASTEYQNWLNGSISLNGKYILVVSYQQTDEDGLIVPNTGVMISSSNYGKKWKPTDAPLNTWTSVVLARNGRVGSATAWGSGIFIRK